MAVPYTSLVEIVRDFLEVHLRLRALFERFRRGDLRFEDVQRLVGDEESSVLYRLKERCHALFRADDRDAAFARPREALFDLAVGSLFHEALKFRENLYQTEIYAPKIRSLREAAGADAGELFDDFEKILAAASIRLGESLSETEELLDHTRGQLRQLLCDHREDRLVARTLYVNRSSVDEVFPEGLDGVLAEMFGDALEGYVAAARSYLDSAYFDEAIDALAEAEKRSEGRAELSQLALYAEGMQAFQTGDYDACLESLDAWSRIEREAKDAVYAELAWAVLSRLELLIDEPDRRAVTEAARGVMSRLEPLTRGASATQAPRP